MALVSELGQAWRGVCGRMPGRTPRQLRDRWTNYLRPEVRKGPWTPEEDSLLLEKVNEYRRSWSRMIHSFSGRSESDIKNRWYTHVADRTVPVGDDVDHRRFATDPELSDLPERKKRNRAVAYPKECALRHLEGVTGITFSGPAPMESLFPVPPKVMAESESVAGGEDWRFDMSSSLESWDSVGCW